MAYPAYSIVIVETTVDGVTTRNSTAHMTASDARATYDTATNAGKRAFLYEQPSPTNFSRKDSQPLAV